MTNYEYIIASLPFLTPDYTYTGDGSFAGITDEIRSLLDKRDSAILDTLLGGFDEKNLDKSFYEAALKNRCGFIRDYFHFDMQLRNAKVRFLNRELGRPEGTDVMILGEEDTEEEFEEAAQIEFVLGQEDILTREKGLDDIMWMKLDEMSLFHWFDLTAILSYVAKLHIVDRWLRLDDATGREMFKKLVNEVRGTFKGVEYKEK